MGWHTPWFWIIAAVVLLILFGGKKLPDAARGLGRSMRIFKSEMDGMKADDQDRAAKAATEQPQAQVTDKPVDVETVQPSDADRKTA